MEKSLQKPIQSKLFPEGILPWIMTLLIALLCSFSGYFLGMNTIRKTSIINVHHVSNTEPQQKNVTNSNNTVVYDPKVQHLIAVAKKVFWQGPYDQYTGYALAFCQLNKTCPFTKQLYENFAKAYNPPGDWGAWFAPGFQNGPFGTLSYLAVPSGLGGTAYITLIPTEAYIKDVGGDGENSLFWTLNLINVNGALLVNNITYATGPFFGNPEFTEKPCGPVNIYDYISVCH